MVYCVVPFRFKKLLWCDIRIYPRFSPNDHIWLGWEDQMFYLYWVFLPIGNFYLKLEVSGWNSETTTISTARKMGVVFYDVVDIEKADS